MQARSRTHSFTNAALLLLVALPPICSVYVLKHAHGTHAQSNTYQASLGALYAQEPILVINALWAIHVDLTFYVISLAQVRTGTVDRST